MNFLIKNTIRCNNLIESNLLVSLRNSLSFLISKIQLFYSVIPFRDLEQDNYRIPIPETLDKLRQTARQSLFFKEETKVLQNFFDLIKKLI